MASNDQVLLKDIVLRNKAELEVQLTDSEYFERFTAEQVLKDFDLSYDSVEAGIVGGGNDGGIDSIFIFVNDEPISLDTDVTEFKRNSKLDLFIIQSKFSLGFAESAIVRFTSFTDDLLDFSKDLSTMRKYYNSGLIQIAEKFKETYFLIL